MSPDSTLFLIVAPLICFIGAYLSAIAGLGGGLVVVAACSQIMPLSMVVPLTSVFVLSGQVARMIQYRDHIDWSITIPFIPGSLIGAIIGSYIYFSLPEVFIALLLGSVMMWFCWVPSSPSSRKIAANIPQPWFWVGIFHTFFSTLSGVGGLFQSMMVNSKLSRHAIVATIAGTLLFMSLFKAAGYMLAGFDYRPYVGVIVLSWIAGIAGTRVGRNFLERFSDLFFRRLLKTVVTIFSLRLFWQAGVILWS